MESVLIDAYETTIVNRRIIRSTLKKNCRVKIYDRVSIIDANPDRTECLKSNRYRFWRKVYDRSADIDSLYGLEGYVKPPLNGTRTDNIPLLNTCLVSRELFCYKMNYTHPMEIERNLKSSPELLKSIWDHSRLISPSKIGIPEIQSSGSNFEDLDVPPALVGSRVTEDGKTVTLVEQCDADMMVVVDAITLITTDALDTAGDAVIDTENTNPGYLRLRLTEKFLRKNQKTLSSCIYNGYLKSNYFEAMLYKELLLLFEKAISQQAKDSPNSIKRVGVKGPALNYCCEISNNLNGPDNMRCLLSDFDLVGALKCAVWPRVADGWLRRKRRSGWPSKQFIDHIASFGCHIVGTSHDFSNQPEIEFRFSFSVAEQQLANELSFEQKQCYVSFKAVIRHARENLKHQTGQEIPLKSYHLKNIFYWGCETISADHWQSPEGWTRCFLFLIDQLLYCLREKRLPGYFVPTYNLLDSASPELLDSLVKEILEVSRDPFDMATEFLNTMVLYNGTPLKESLRSKKKKVPTATLR